MSNGRQLSPLETLEQLSQSLKSSGTGFVVEIVADWSRGGDDDPDAPIALIRDRSGEAVGELSLRGGRLRVRNAKKTVIALLVGSLLTLGGPGAVAAQRPEWSGGLGQPDPSGKPETPCGVWISVWPPGIKPSSCVPESPDKPQPPQPPLPPQFPPFPIPQPAAPAAPTIPAPAVARGPVATGAQVVLTKSDLRDLARYLRELEKGDPADFVNWISVRMPWLVHPDSRLLVNLGWPDGDNSDPFRPGWAFVQVNNEGIELFREGDYDAAASRFIDATHLWMDDGVDGDLLLAVAAWNTEVARAAAKATKQHLVDTGPAAGDDWDGFVPGWSPEQTRYARAVLAFWITPGKGVLVPGDSPDDPGTPDPVLTGIARVFKLLPDVVQAGVETKKLLDILPDLPAQAEVEGPPRP